MDHFVTGTSTVGNFSVENWDIIINFLFVFLIILEQWNSLEITISVVIIYSPQFFLPKLGWFTTWWVGSHLADFQDDFYLELNKLQQIIDDMTHSANHLNWLVLTATFNIHELES